MPHGEFRIAVKILISGGLGFVGSRIAEYLSLEGHKIILASRNITTAPTWLPDAGVIEIDWNDMASLEKACKGVDIVIHAAGMNARDCVADPIGALNFNGKSTGKFAKAALNAGVARFIYISTAHVYSSKLTGFISEKNIPINTHPYATSHLAGENEILCLDQSKMWSIVIRLSNAFGAPKDLNANCWMLLINNLCKQAVQTNKLVLKSSGLEFRDFISLEQVCRVIAAFTSSKIKPIGINIFNLGTGTSKSIIEMARLVQQRCEQVLNFEPELISSARSSRDHEHDFCYQNSNLSLLGIETDDRFNLDEIDNLLHFCNNNFS